MPRVVRLCFHALSAIALFLAAIGLTATLQAQEPKPSGGVPERLNVLIVTVDDMSADSLGVFGCPLPETSPSIDAFAKTALRFNHAHVHVGNCMPGRNLMWSGLFSNVNGVEGFQQNRNPDYPVLCDLAKSAGYFTAIRGKVSHSTPYTPYAWDADVTQNPDGGQYHIKDPASYGASTRNAIAMAEEAGKPFCLMVNISDPHKPFYNTTKRGEQASDPYVPTRVFSADEVPVPGFLPSDDVIKDELASYYSSVRRADDAFRSVMQALEQSGKFDRTFIMFLSDHGMPLPFAKTQLYHHSTRTPLMVRWPGVTKAGTADDVHMVSAIDFLPTLLDVMQTSHPTPQRLHGRSFAPLLKGETQDGRDHVVLQYNENSGRNRHPMRGIQTKKYLYLYNPWSDGERKFATATTGTATYRQMVKRAAKEPEIAARLELFDHRVLQELYDVASDPDCLQNLIDAPSHQSELILLRKTLLAELKRIDDPVAPVLSDIDNDSLRNEFMAAEDAKKQTAVKRSKTPGKKSVPASSNARAGTKKLRDAIAITAVTDGEPFAPGDVLEIRFAINLPEALGEQKMHVTLKQCEPNAKTGGIRLERQVVAVSGKAEKLVRFTVSKDSLKKDPILSGLSVAAFIGEDFTSNLQHIVSPTWALQRD
ncbi:sulfatase family protein [Stieleria varia]|uniref:Arylsulfatase n=1 Tax=Stieleria varia TaxID=2528005 RepID=A0A5C6AWV4_9BACT|nr:sulfatase [Stieleria varia]TWU04495.1 Arylsulfatase [Stieleria varia]